MFLLAVQAQEGYAAVLQSRKILLTSACSH